MATENVIDLADISVVFKKKEEQVKAVDDVSLKVKSGSIFGIVGFSGAGKSTLVRVINLLQHPTSGTVTVNGKELQGLTDQELRGVRKKIGMIFQHFNLLRSRTVLNNVEYPLLSEKISRKDRRDKAKKLLDLVGLGKYSESYPTDLSGGQQQRVAIARALANDPDILISDEATSALDPQTTAAILKLLRKLNKELGLTVVLITHEMQVIKSICQEVAVMENGRIIEKGPVANVFAEPQHKLTRDFVESAANIKQMKQQIREDGLISRLNSNQRLLYLKFSNQAADEAVIYELAEKFGIKANILFANVEKVGSISLGYMVVILSAKSGDVQPGIDYLKKVGVIITSAKEREDQGVS